MGLGNVRNGNGSVPGTGQSRLFVNFRLDTWPVGPILPHGLARKLRIQCVFGVCKTTSAILRGEGRSRRRTLDEANAHRISPRVLANLCKTQHGGPLLLAESDGNSLL